MTAIMSAGWWSMTETVYRNGYLVEATTIGNPVWSSGYFICHGIVLWWCSWIERKLLSLQPHRALTHWVYRSLYYITEHIVSIIHIFLIRIGSRAFDLIPCINSRPHPSPGGISSTTLRQQAPFALCLGSVHTLPPPHSVGAATCAVYFLWTCWGGHCGCLSTSHFHQLTVEVYYRACCGVHPSVPKSWVGSFPTDSLRFVTQHTPTHHCTH